MCPLQTATRGELDFAVALGPWQEAGEVAFSAIAKVSFSWMASPARIGAGTLLGREIFQQHPVITMTEESAVTRAVDAWAAAQGLPMQRIVACNSFMANTGLAVAGVGISVFPTRFMQPWIERGLLVELRSIPPLPDLEFCFLNRPDESRNLVYRMKRYVIEEVDYTLEAPLL